MATPSLLFGGCGVRLMRRKSMARALLIRSPEESA
jgi:hypothetical protein